MTKSLPLLFAFLVFIHKIHSQTSQIDFTEVATNIPGNNFSTNAWGDYDSDGDLDLLIVGPSYSKIFRNTAGVLTEINTSLPAVNRSSASWGDYDNDGDLDLAMNGFSSPSAITKVYQNTNGVFTDINANILGLSQGSVAWGDYDNDGDLDLLITGGDNSNNPKTRIYKNTNGLFSVVNVQLADVWYSEGRWGDYDNDGDLDVILSGSENSSVSSVIKIFKNTNGAFNYVDIGLMGVNGGALALGDYDSDGDLDILISGANYPNLIAKIYKNNGGSFTDTEASLVPLYGGSAEWGDYDNDGDLDILMTGDSSFVTNNEVLRTKIYTNKGGVFEDSKIKLTGVIYGDAKWGDYDNDNDLDIILTGSVASTTVCKLYRNESLIKNTNPTIPIALTPRLLNGNITLKWKKSKDAETSTDALSSNVYLGTVSKGSGRISPMSDLVSGYRKIVAHGNAHTRDSIQINNLPTGVYYWGVQSIDNSFASSTFSSENSFAVNMPPAITSFLPAEGIKGTEVTISGNNFYGLVSVDINGTDAKFSVVSPTVLKVTVPESASTGLITIKAVGGVGASVTPFIVLPFFSQLATELPNVSLGSMSWGDYDNDNDQDLLITGETPDGILITKIYTSVDGTSFAELSGTNFTGVRNSDAKWGDYDNDNDLDFIVSGLGNAGPYVTKVYTNIGNGKFEELTTSAFKGVFNSSVSWVDYDNDGDLDVFLTGDMDMVPFSIMYNNQGNGLFNEITLANIPNLTQASVSWGDFDNDRDLDILMTGLGIDHLSQTNVFQNIGNGSFSKLNISLPGVLNGNAKWGDYDGDGDLDFVLTGGIGNSGLTKIYTNNGNKTFTEKANSNLLQLGDGSDAKWADFDNDGDLDLQLMGREGPFTQIKMFSKIYLNNSNSFDSLSFSGIYQQNGESVIGDYDNDTNLDLITSSYDGVRVFRNNFPPRNSNPTTPANLSVANSNNEIIFSWSKSTDDSTPQNALKYNLRVGRSSGATDVVSPMANISNGFYKTNPSELTNQNSARIKSLAPGDYYWSIQAIDNGFAASPFSTEGSFTIYPAPTITGFTPASGMIGSTATIIGTNFTGATSVNFGGVSAVYTITNSTTIIATVPVGATTGKLWVTTPSGTATSVADFTITLPAPTIASFTPVSGIVGSLVTITGTNFTGATSLKFDGISAVYSITSATTINATVPVGATTGKLSVTTPSGTAISAADFTITLPATSIEGFTPKAGIVGSIVTITGSNLSGASSVTFNGISAKYKIINSITIETIVPAGASSGPISVTTPSGTAVSKEHFSFTYSSPIVTSFSPTIGTVGSQVIITGNDFTHVIAVEFNGINSIFERLDATTIRATVPSAAATGKISLISQSGTATTNEDFTITPLIREFTPVSEKVGGNVTIKGYTFTGSTSVKFNGKEAVYSVSNDSTIKATVPDGATTGKITVTTESGTAISAGNFVVVHLPIILNFTPVVGLVGSTVTIRGTNFTGATSVKFNGTPAVYTVTNATTISTTVPAGATTGKISVTTATGTAMSAGSFTVSHPVPAITTFTPANGVVGSAVTITGAYLTGATSVKFNGAAAVYTIANATTISTTVPAGATTGKISVTTPSGTAISINDFKVVYPPTIVGFTPVNGVVRSAVTITGTNLAGATSLKFNGMPAVFNVANATTISTTVPAGATTGKITVTTPSGTAISISDFKVVYPPTIVSFTPTMGVVGNTVTITGTNLTGATAVEFNGIASIYAVTNTTTILATVPVGATTGKISIIAPDGTVESVGNYTVTLPAPTIVSCSPSSGVVGSSVTITGTNFTGTTTVKFGDISAVYDLISASVIKAIVPLGAENGKISVIVAENEVSSYEAFEVIPDASPSLTDFSPKMGLSGASISIFGKDFNDISEVKFNSVNADFVIVNSNLIKATVPLSATSGKISLTNKKGLIYSGKVFEALVYLNAPGSVKTTSDEQSITLKWDDLSDNEEGFIVERFINNTTQFAPIDTVNRDVSTYVDYFSQEQGKRYYKVVAFNGNSRSDYSEIVAGEISRVTGTEKPFLNDVRVYPNPTSDFLNIELTSSTNTEILVTDVLGNTIKKVRPQDNEKIIHIDLRKETSGVYIVKVNSRGATKCFKLSKE